MQWCQSNYCSILLSLRSYWRAPRGDGHFHPLPLDKAPNPADEFFKTALDILRLEGYHVGLSNQHQVQDTMELSLTSLLVPPHPALSPPFSTLKMLSLTSEVFIAAQ